MALHLSAKLSVVGLVVAALITAFSIPPSEPQGVALAVAPQVRLLAAPRAVEADGGIVHGPDATPSFTVRATGYNSHASQTDSTPFITATGAQTRFGIIAVSRDLLGGAMPYGSLVRIRDLGNYYNGRGAGAYQGLLDSQGLFIVEDTMHARKTQQVDVWFEDYSSAVNWGVRQVEVEVIRYGRTGPILDADLAADPGGSFDGVPQLLAAR